MKMTEYEGTLLENFMICGVRPNAIMENVIADYKPDVLFSYPESPDYQRGVLAYLLPKNFVAVAEKPPDSPVEKYLLTNELGETLYAYWKIVHEKITDELLSEFRNIHNIDIESKDIHCKEIVQSSSDVCTHSIQRTPDKYVSKHAKCSPDGMNLASSDFTECAKPLKDSSITQKIYIPLAFCIKTKNPSTKQAETLLCELIALLYSNHGTYISELQNNIYSFAEFCTYILTLTKLPTPPPLTELCISINNHDIIYYEGLLGDFPGESDNTTIPQLFSLVNTEYVVYLWTALLLNIRVIIYTSDPNTYFAIAKPLNELLFPFTYTCLKGITPSVELLTGPTPYCFGIMKSSFNDKGDLLAELDDENLTYVLFDIENEHKQIMQIVSKETVPMFPRFCQLKQKLDKIKQDTGLKENKSKEFKKAFLSELMPIFRAFDSALKTDCDNFKRFTEEFLVNYKKQAGNVGKNEANFINAIIDSQVFAYLYDEAKEEQQKNYARVQAMMEPCEGGFPEVLRISLQVTPKTVLDNLKKLAEARESIMGKRNDKCEWGIEMAFGKADESNDEKLCDTIYSSLILADSVYSYPECIRRDGKSYIEPSEIIMKEEETIKVHPSHRSCSNMNMTCKVPEKQKTSFYGKKGALAFLQEFLCTEKSKEIDKAIGVVDRINKAIQTFTSSSEHCNKESEQRIDEYLYKADDETAKPKETPGELPKSSTLAKPHFQSPLIFSNTNIFQYNFFAAIFYANHYESEPLLAINELRKAYGKLRNDYQGKLSPVNFLKALVQKLELKDIRPLLMQFPEKVTRVIKDVYEEKLKDEINGRMSFMVISMKLSNMQSNKQEDCGGYSKVPRITLSKSKLEKSKIIVHAHADTKKTYVNSYKKIHKTVNNDPNVIIESALKDLVLLLLSHKKQGKRMFNCVRIHKEFLTIEKHAALLKSRYFFIKNRNAEPTPENQWLVKEEDKLAFFLNLRNFIVLFSLCKNSANKLPVTPLEWLKYLDSVSVKVSTHIFSVLEIEHGILRNNLPVPPALDSSLISLNISPIISPADPRSEFKLNEGDPLVDLAFYYPAKYCFSSSHNNTRCSVPLKVYTPSKVHEQLKENVKASQTLPCKANDHALDFEFNYNSN